MPFYDFKLDNKRKNVVHFIVFNSKNYLRHAGSQLEMTNIKKTWSF